MRFAYSVHEPLAGWGGLVGGVRWKGREREGVGGGIGPYRYYLFPTLSPGWGYGFMVVVPGGMSEGGGCA